MTAGAPERPAIFYGWWIVGAGFCTQLMLGMLMFHPFGTYVALM